MSNFVLDACWPLELPPCTKFVLISLADHADATGYCWPSISTICAHTCLGRTAVFGAIKHLEDAGLVTVDKSNGRHNRYYLLPGRLPVHETNRSAMRTGTRGEHQQSATRTPPVRHANTNQQEPPRSITTTASIDNVSLDWGAPTQLMQSLLSQAPTQVVEVIQQAKLAPDVKRYILVEVVARMRSERGRVDSPVAFTKKLVASAINGTFSLSAGQHLESDLLRRTDEVRKAAERRAEAQARADSAVAPEVTAKRDEALRQLAKLGFHLPSTPEPSTAFIASARGFSTGT